MAGKKPFQTVYSEEMTFRPDVLSVSQRWSDPCCPYGEMQGQFNQSLLGLAQSNSGNQISSNPYTGERLFVVFLSCPLSLFLSLAPQMMHKTGGNGLCLVALNSISGAVIFEKPLEEN